MRQPSEEEIRALEAEMAKLSVDDVLLQTIVTLINLGARKAGLAGDTEADWPQVKKAIDGARALFSLVEAEHGEALAPVRDLAVLDPYNPRSVAFQVATLNDHIAALPSLKEHGLIERPQRLAVALQATLTTAEAATLDVKTLFALEQDLLNLADAIGLHYFPHGPNASRPEKLTGLA